MIQNIPARNVTILIMHRVQGKHRHEARLLSFLGNIQVPRRSDDLHLPGAQQSQMLLRLRSVAMLV